MDHLACQSGNKQSFLPPHQKSLNKKQSKKKKRVKSSNVKLPVKRLSVRCAHACVSRSLNEAKVHHVSRTKGKHVVRICSRTTAQLESTNAILKELLQHNYIEEIGMPVNYAYKMKSLIFFIKAFDANCSKKIASKFRNSGLNFHITVNPYQKNKNLSKTPNDEPKTKTVEAKPITKVVEEVKQIVESLNARQEDKYLLWEVLITLLLSISIGFLFFWTQFAVVECFLVILYSASP